MRIFISAFLFLTAGAAVLYWLSQAGGPELPPSPLHQSNVMGAQSPESETEAVVTAKREPSPEPLQRNIRDVTGSGMIPPPSLEGDMIVRLPAAEPPPQPQRPVKPSQWPRSEVASAGVLKSGDTMIRIAGIEPLAAEATCKANEGGEWPCGNFARAAFQRLIRLRTVECDPLPETSTASPAIIVTDCRISGRDIAQWLIERGWAVPVKGAVRSEVLEKALEKAKSGRLGQWRETAPGQG
ncbi:MAG: thermonuclease family protein [Nitratireductor sp.]